MEYRYSGRKDIKTWGNEIQYLFTECSLKIVLEMNEGILWWAEAPCHTSFVSCLSFIANTVRGIHGDNHSTPSTSAHACNQNLFHSQWSSKLHTYNGSDPLHTHTNTNFTLAFERDEWILLAKEKMTAVSHQLDLCRQREREKETTEPWQGQGKRDESLRMTILSFGWLPR